jgi:hypothetical protein
MSDSHLRLLRGLARQRQRELDEHLAARVSPRGLPSQRQQRLEGRATRSRERVSAAQARRRRAF